MVIGKNKNSIDGITRYTPDRELPCSQCVAENESPADDDGFCMGWFLAFSIPHLMSFPPPVTTSVRIAKSSGHLPVHLLLTHECRATLFSGKHIFSRFPHPHMLPSFSF